MDDVKDVMNEMVRDGLIERSHNGEAEEGPANYAAEELGRARETIGRLRHELSLLKSEAPAPRQEDLQVSPENGPDYDAKWFRGGITNVSHVGGVLTFEFATGGKIHVSNPVVYVMPEQH